MTLKTVKESESCKISFVQNKDKILSVVKEFKDLETLQKEYELSSILDFALKAEKENNNLTYPYLTSLSSRISKPIPEPEALNIMTQCCEILKELKENQIIHRDLKPGNLYLDESQNIFVSDFETAISKKWSANKKTCGTPGFMAPEQYSDSEVDWLADQYSLGVVYFNILTGTLPFSGESIEEIRESQLNSTPDPSMNNTKLKKPFSELVMKMMNKNKEDRIQSIEDIQKALDICSQSLQNAEILEDKAVKIIPRKKEVPKKQNMLFNIIILVAALVLVMVLFKSL